MWKNAFSAAAAAICFASTAVAAEGSRLSVPNLQAESVAEAVNGAATLRPARIGIVEAVPGSGTSRSGTIKRSSSTPQKATQLKTSPPKEIATRKSAEKKSVTSSRRTALPRNAESREKKITFHPAEVVPLKEDPRLTSRPQPVAPVGEVQYPVMPSESLAGESTAEYEEDYAPLVSSESAENFAPIISAADMPRPDSVRRTAASETPTAPDVSLPPLTPKPSAAPAAQPEEKPAGREPGRLSSILKGGLRLPEFRSRPARDDSGR